MRRSTVGRAALLVAAATLAASACASTTGDSGADGDGLEPAIIAATPTPASGVGDGSDELVELPEVEEGVLVNRFDLDPGDCFNTYAVVDFGEDAQPTTRVVECTRPHESEVYLQRSFPAGPGEAYPGEEDIRAWADEQCYGDFEEFAAAEYELSALEIGVIHPTDTTWSGPGLHREITCYVFSATGGGLQGSMDGSGI
ncbi:MAG: septum formation family protein [Acidimicrobiia bacterium]|nr:septum formation family protein [Acidimicrobiia bacterium]